MPRILKNDDKTHFNNQQDQSIIKDDTLEMKTQRTSFSFKKLNEPFNLETDTYSIESLFDYWQSNKTTIKIALNDQFMVISKSIYFVSSDISKISLRNCIIRQLRIQVKSLWNHQTPIIQRKTDMRMFYHVNFTFLFIHLEMRDFQNF